MMTGATQIVEIATAITTEIMTIAAEEMIADIATVAAFLKEETFTLMVQLIRIKFNNIRITPNSHTGEEVAALTRMETGLEEVEATVEEVAISRTIRE